MKVHMDFGIDEDSDHRCYHVLIPAMTATQAAANSEPLLKTSPLVFSDTDVVDATLKESSRLLPAEFLQASCVWNRVSVCMRLLTRLLQPPRSPLQVCIIASIPVVLLGPQLQRKPCERQCLGVPPHSFSALLGSMWCHTNIRYFSKAFVRSACSKSFQIPNFSKLLAPPSRLLVPRGYTLIRRKYSSATCRNGRIFLAHVSPPMVQFHKASSRRSLSPHPPRRGAHASLCPQSY